MKTVTTSSVVQVRKISAVKVVSGLEIANGGPSYSVPRFNDALIAAGIDGKIYSSLIPGELANNNAKEVVTFARSLGHALLLGRLHICGSLQRRLPHEPPEFDIVHSHGLSMPCFWAGSTSVHQICSIDRG